jgi:transcriptional regulator with XRE-family HTH domain
MSEVGKKIRAARIEKQMQLQTLADSLGVRAPSVAQIESGRVLPSPDRLPALAELLELDLVELSILEAMDRGRIALPPGTSREQVQVAVESVLAQQLQPEAEPHDPHACECPKCGAVLSVSVKGP